MMKLLLILIMGFLIMPLVLYAGSIPEQMNYQGYLTDNAGNPVPDGIYEMTIKIYDDPEGNDLYWSFGTLSVEVEDGLFNIILNNVISSYIPFDGDAYLGIKVGSDPEMRPLTPLTTTPYAFRAVIAELVINGSVYDYTINTNAEINPAKIAGTAALIENTNHFINTNYFGDSAVVIDNVGMRIGNNGDPLAYSPFSIERHYNVASPNSRYGALAHVYNSNTGTLFGTWSKAQRTSSASTTKYTYGLFGIGQNDYEVGTTCGIFGYASGGSYARAVCGQVNGTHLEQEYAGYFLGDVGVQGEIIYLLGGYRIDHPLDPENKYLYHSDVTSPDMMNIYNGNVVTDSKGSAEVILPDYFEELNQDYRYQLTVIGTFAQAIIKEEISNNRFVITTNEPNIKVSWQVTGIRKDPAAEARRIVPEREKNDLERGTYIYPEGYGLGEERSVDYEAKMQAIEAAKGTGGE